MSYANNLKVGAVIYENGQIFTGFNGTIPGYINRCEDKEGKTLKAFVIHAEANALIKAQHHKFEDATLYVTHSPCIDCARAIVDKGGIKRVIYGAEFKKLDGIEYLKSKNIDVIKYIGE